MSAPHETYLRAIVDALEADGIGVADWFADLNDPLDGAVELAATATAAGWGDRSVWLGWTEERGWYYGSCSPQAHGGELTAIRYLAIGVLPRPAELVPQVRRIVAGDRPGYLTPTRYRYFEDDEDGFAAQLAQAAVADLARGGDR
ncbi:MAG TPA: DUF6292 family protein [Pseudonocardiaceae bacterium]|nr:DUF6292 family protein [Pseudonocardiaceae bacterium]